MNVRILWTDHFLPSEKLWREHQSTGNLRSVVPDGEWELEGKPYMDKPQKREMGTTKKAFLLLLDCLGYWICLKLS